ncbi:hypothetical protein [Defluviicoccus vanus]|uniref:Uncharacterized protein n=1 Tax=Defluviicoccus vanus TaxID=111831 RepID=A0A7H1N1H5_9PROT|nr:hypothetical protein [Defluviicoccus vanus]QNT69561.1 hypothetical protein HQ394_09750 [Defluviicoccus vanus]
MGWFARRSCALLACTVLLGTAAVLTAARPAAAASGSVFAIAEVIEEVQRQLAAADQNDSQLHVDDASLELTLVEGVGSKAGGLAVPGADFTFASKDDGGRPSLKQRLLLDVAATKGTKTASNGGSGKLTAAIQEVKASVQQAMAAGGNFELKKLTLDFDFAVERDGKGAPSLIVYARDRHIDSPSVQGIKVRFTTKEK